MKFRFLAAELVLCMILSTAVFSQYGGSNSSSILGQSYTPPSSYSFLVAIALIVIVLLVGFSVLKNVLSTVVLLVILFILASVAYSFFETGSLSLGGATGFVSSIISFIGSFLSAAHSVASTANALASSSNTAIP